MYKSKPSSLLQCIKIQTDNGSISRSCYNEPLPGLNVGQRVNAGDIIGKSQDVKPRYGQSTPQHIHYELSYNGKTIDTESLYQ
jgi:murein DD-endopeptidase MepM/ murein hydrolase activator NlpD